MQSCADEGQMEEDWTVMGEDGKQKKRETLLTRWAGKGGCDTKGLGL